MPGLKKSGTPDVGDTNKHDGVPVGSVKGRGSVRRQVPHRGKTTGRPVPPKVVSETQQHPSSAGECGDERRASKWTPPKKHGDVPMESLGGRSRPMRSLGEHAKRELDLWKSRQTRARSGHPSADPTVSRKRQVKNAVIWARVCPVVDPVVASNPKWVATCGAGRPSKKRVEQSDEAARKLACLSCHEVAFTAYYPADLDRNSKRRKGVNWLVRPAAAALEGFSRFGGVSTWLMWPIIYLFGVGLKLNHVEIPAYRNAPLLHPGDSHKQWPLVIKA
ncbi:hypothetical protein C8R45DRAFT_1067250 [Mycena sanguinolenta]|nr:hypothetical protein C8R45DRAFT_1067250 [Mycena sanguinolenta]